MNYVELSSAYLFCGKYYLRYFILQMNTKIQFNMAIIVTQQ